MIGMHDDGLILSPIFMGGELAELFLYLILQPGAFRFVREIFSNDFAPLRLADPRFAFGG